MSLRDFLHMGGYAPYVWSCYGLTLAVLIYMEWMSREGLKKARIQALRRAQTGSSAG